MPLIQLSSIHRHRIRLPVTVVSVQVPAHYPIGMAAIIQNWPGGARFFLQIASNNNFHSGPLRNCFIPSVPFHGSANTVSARTHSLSIVYSSYCNGARYNQLSDGLLLRPCCQCGVDSDVVVVHDNRSSAGCQCVVHRPWRDRPEQAPWTRVAGYIKGRTSACSGEESSSPRDDDAT